MAENQRIYARIQDATDHELRTVLAGLCAESGNTKKKVQKLFDQLAEAEEAYAKRRLQVPALYICINCRKAYSESENGSQACHYHTGVIVLDPDSEAWVDCWGDEVHDSEDMREDNPEGFMWTCCKKTSDSPGCRSGSHRQGGAKRAGHSGSTSRPTDGIGSKKRARTE